MVKADLNRVQQRANNHTNEGNKVPWTGQSLTCNPGADAETAESGDVDRNEYHQREQVGPQLGLAERGGNRTQEQYPDDHVRAIDQHGEAKGQGDGSLGAIRPALPHQRG
jgi:hypothetical protein